MSPSLSLPRCLSLTVSPSLSLPRCVSLAVPPSLSLPHCLSLAVSPPISLPQFLSLAVSPSRGLCRMKMLPVMILANYHSSARSAVSERPNPSARLVFPMFQVELRLAFECSNSNTNDRQFEVCAFGWVFFTISITFCHSMPFMSMY